MAFLTLGVPKSASGTGLYKYTHIHHRSPSGITKYMCTVFPLKRQLRSSVTATKDNNNLLQGFTMVSLSK